MPMSWQHLNLRLKYFILYAEKKNDAFQIFTQVWDFQLQFVVLAFFFFHSGNTEHLLLHVLYLYLSIFIQLVYHEQLVLRCILFQHSAGLTTAVSPFGIRDSKIRAYLSSL